ncbi:MAG TPA: NADP-dependent oxidoreductase [Candidatus Deferrimicrobium sp.]|nr:NADP-dependent oxidoreductase [Candidatus Deferrimicrobium sp.]
MLAIVAERFGPPEVLRIRDWPDPTPGPGEILVAVEAAGVNPVDAGNRADGTWAGIEPPMILGSDLAGTVMALGEGVQAFAPGDRVLAMVEFLGRQEGAYAQLVTLPADWAAPIPDGVDVVEAAAVPLAAGTAYEAIVNRLAVRADEIVVILGAAGGVGVFAVQLAAAAGAHVIAVASETHWDLLRSLGVTECVDYRGRQVADAILRHAPGGADAVLDLVGGGSLAAVLGSVRPGGRAATTVALDGDLEPAIDRNLILHGILVRPDGARLRAIAGLMAAGRLRVVVDRTYPWEEAADAHARVETGHGRGKVVLLVPSLRRSA